MFEIDMNCSFCKKEKKGKTMFLFPFKKKGTICQCKIGKERKKKKGKGELLTSEPSYCSLKNCLTIKEVYVSIFYSKKGNKNVLFCNCKIITSELQRDHPSSVVYKYFNVLEAPMKTNTPYNFVASFIEQNREHTFIGLMKKNLQQIIILAQNSKSLN